MIFSGIIYIAILLVVFVVIPALVDVAKMSKKQEENQ